MGALPRLKKKIEMQYRKGSTNEKRNCRFCIYYVDSAYMAFGGDVPRVEARCKIVGVEHSSIRYRIRPDHTCNAQSYNGK